MRQTAIVWIYHVYLIHLLSYGIDVFDNSLVLDTLYHRWILVNTGLTFAACHSDISCVSFVYILHIVLNDNVEYSYDVHMLTAVHKYRHMLVHLQYRVNLTLKENKILYGYFNHRYSNMSMSKYNTGKHGYYFISGLYLYEEIIFVKIAFPCSFC